MEKKIESVIFDMKKRLVFFIYVDTLYRGSKIYDLHFALLKRYSKIFDAATLYFSLKEINDENLCFARELAKRIIDCGFINDVEIKIRQNTTMREVDCFKEEVVGRIIDNVPELVFFTHTKGLSNEITDSLLDWICGMYYFSLGFIEDAEKSLVYRALPDTENRGSIFYGFPLLKSRIENYLKERIFYAGTIYWINCGKAAQYNKAFGVNPEKDYIYGSRCFAEEFPGNYFLGCLSTGPFLPSVEEFSLYTEFDNQLSNIYRDNIGWFNGVGFDVFCNEIKQEVFYD